MAFRDAAVAEVNPDGLRFRDEVADGEDQAFVDEHAIAGALGAERFRSEGVDGMIECTPTIDDSVRSRSNG